MECEATEGSGEGISINAGVSVMGCDQSEGGGIGYDGGVEMTVFLFPFFQIKHHDYHDRHRSPPF